MPETQTYDLFISHAWRYHESWMKLVDLLDNQAGFAWRNFSVPWHDPAKHPGTPDGAEFVRDWLKSQIRPANAVVILADVYEKRSARKWLEFQIDYARELKIPIIVVLPEDDTGLEIDYKALGHPVVEWDIIKVIDALRAIAAKPQSNSGK